MYRKYMVYLDDGEHCYKIAVPAICEESAAAWCKGNGEVIAVKDVTDKYPIDETKVRAALQAAGFGMDEMDFMCRALVELDIIR